MRPFFIITPLGVAHADALCARIEELGVAIIARKKIDGWPMLATKIYLRSSDEEATLRAKKYERAWSAYEEQAELVEIADHRALIAAKRALRAQLPGGRGKFPSRGSHRSGRAKFSHPARRITYSLRHVGNCAECGRSGVAADPTTA